MQDFVPRSVYSSNGSRKCIVIRRRRSPLSHLQASTELCWKTGDWHPQRGSVHTYKVLNGTPSVHLSDLDQNYKPVVRLSRSEFGHNLRVPNTRSATYGKMPFSASAPSLWNEFSEPIKLVSSQELLSDYAEVVICNPTILLSSVWSALK